MEENSTEDVTYTEEKNTENIDSLLGSISEETEYKKPGENSNQNEWNFDASEDVKEGDKKTTSSDKDKKQISGKVKEESAKAAVGMLDLVQRSIFTPLISLKYKKKFSPDEIKRLDEKKIIDSSKSDLIDEDLMLREKWDRLMNKCQKKIDDIELTKSERTTLETAFYQYFEAKQTSLPVEWFVGFALIDVLGKRTIDVFTD